MSITLSICGHIRLRDVIFVHCKGKGVTYVLLHNGGFLQPLHHKTLHHITLFS
jgi:hypothetical protein